MKIQNRYSNVNCDFDINRNISLSPNPSRPGVVLQHQHPIPMHAYQRISELDVSYRSDVWPQPQKPKPGWTIPTRTYERRNICCVRPGKHHVSFLPEQAFPSVGRHTHTRVRHLPLRLKRPSGVSGSLDACHTAYNPHCGHYWHRLGLYLTRLNRFINQNYCSFVLLQVYWNLITFK